MQSAIKKSLDKYKGPIVEARDALQKGLDADEAYCVIETSDI